MLPIDRVGSAGSAGMVAVAVLVVMIAPELAPESTSENVSNPSLRPEANTGTTTCFVVSPAPKVMVPVTPVKSLPAVAVPLVAV